MCRELTSQKEALLKGEKNTVRVFLPLLLNCLLISCCMFLVLFAMQEIEPRGSCMLGKQPARELPQLWCICMI